VRPDAAHCHREFTMVEYATGGYSFPRQPRGLISPLEETSMSPSSLSCGVAACAMLALAASAAAAKGPVFDKLFDTSFVAPDGQLIFTIDRPQMAGKTVAFIGATSTPSVYLFSVPVGGGTPVVLVSNSTKVPGGTGDFTGNQLGYFTAFEPAGCSSPAVGTKDVVFVGRDAAGHEGIYAVPLNGGKIVRLVDYGTPIPGGPVQGHVHFEEGYSFCNISVSGSTVAFDAGSAGVYEVDTKGNNLIRIADPNTPATIHTFEVNQYVQPALSGTKIAYVGGTVFGPFAIFDGPPDLAHALVIAKRSKFDGLAFPVISGSDIDYSVNLQFPNQGIYRAEIGGDANTKIMDYNTKVPAGAPGTSFYATGSADSGENWSPAGTLNVIAASTTDGTSIYPGLFSSCKTNKLTKILTQGDTLDGVEDVGPGAGISNLVAQKNGSSLGAILVAGFRYAAIYTVEVPGC